MGRIQVDIWLTVLPDPGGQNFPDMGFGTPHAGCLLPCLGSAGKLGKPPAFLVFLSVLQVLLCASSDGLNYNPGGLFVCTQASLPSLS